MKSFRTNWLNASKDERQILYEFTMRLVGENGLDFMEINKKALGLQALSETYHNEFRAGRISRKHAQKIYHWISIHYPCFITLIDDAVLEAQLSTNNNNWISFLNSYGKFIIINNTPLISGPAFKECEEFFSCRRLTDGDIGTEKPKQFVLGDIVDGLGHVVCLSIFR